MRGALFALLLLFALPAAAEQFGDIVIAERTGLGWPETNSFYEYRFDAGNLSAEPHRVTITVQSTAPYTNSVTRSSRSFVLAPRSSNIVTIPLAVASNGFGAATAVVTIDGRRQSRTVSMRSVGADYSQALTVLGGPITPIDRLQRTIEEQGWSDVRAVRADAAQQDWPTSWQQYGRFEAVLLSSADWSRTPPAVRQALLRWVRAGGVLALMGEAEGLPRLDAVQVAGNVTTGTFGFGRILRLPADDATLTPNDFHAVRAVLRRLISIGVAEETLARSFPILLESSVPRGTMLTVLIGFAVVAGPVNLFLLARRNRRLWLFWTVPLLAIVTSAIVVGSLLLHEGMVSIQRTRSITLLDERAGEATTIGWTGFYATVAPDEVRFDSLTEFQTLAPTPPGDLDATEGLRLRAWARSRVPTYFAVRKSEPRRERVVIRSEGGRLVAVNGLGAPVATLLFADAGGVLHEAQNVSPGAKVPLTTKGERIPADAKHPATLLGPPEGWAALHARLAGNPRTVLQPGTYVAVMPQSPFVERAIDASDLTSEAVVIGVMKGEGDAR